MASDKETISFRDYVDERFRSVAAATDAALQAVREETRKAEAANERRFASVNEFREALNDNARLLMPRLEAEQANRGLSEKIDQLTLRLNARDDRGHGMSALWGVVVGVIGVAAAIVTLIYKR